MLHHMSFAVNDLKRSGVFYDAVLGALGFVRVWTKDDAVGYGPHGGEDKFAIKKLTEERVSLPIKGSHVAFSATSQVAVRAFHEAALSNGGSDNGKPGFRPKYGPNYFAAFVADPDGYRIEAVCT